MPFIEEEKLAQLRQEIETLQIDKEELESNFEDSEKENKSLSANVKGLMALLFLFAIGVFVFGFLYYQVKKDKETLFLNKEAVIAKKLDSIEASYGSYDSQVANDDFGGIEDAVDELIYTIQIGAFKNYDLSKYPEKELRNFRRMPNQDLHTYSIGKFNKVKQAKNFLKEIRRIGIRDAFILPIKNGERLSLKQAIALEGN